MHILEAADKKIIMEEFPKKYQESSIFDFDISSIEKYLKAREQLDKEPFFNVFEERQVYVRLSGYVVVTKQLCRALAGYIGEARVLEVMSGKGVLAKGLREEGVNIKPTDDYSWGMSQAAWIDDIEKIDAIAAIQKYAKDMDFLIIGWPPMGNYIDEIIEATKRCNKNIKIIYIGEGAGGCTGDGNFWGNTIDAEDEEFSCVVQSYKTWRGIHDSVYLRKVK